MLVADTTALAHLYLPGGRRASAMEAYQRDPDWVTAPLWRYEFVNVLWKILKAGLCDLAAAEENFQLAFERMGPRERSPNDVQAIEIALRHRITAYDAYFVTLALTLESRLLTEDQELLRKFPDIAISLEAFCREARM